MDIPSILKFMHPTAVWSIGEDYDSLNWPDQEIPKPSLNDISNSESEYLKLKILDEYSSIIQDHVEGTAMQKQYGSAQSCASYINSTNVQWKAEAEAFIAWRDKVWEYSMQEMPKFISGERQLIPALDFINELPAMVWPS